MNKRTIILSGIIILVLIILGFSLFYKSTPIGDNYFGIINNARYLDDPSLCDKIDNADYNNYCLAVVKKDASLCEVVKNQEVKDMCYFGLPLSLETCRAIQNNDMKGECLLNFGLVTLNSSVCEIIPDAEGKWRSRDDPNIREYRPTAYRDNCFLGIRLETNDTILCSSIVEEVLIDYCISPPEDEEMIDLSKTFVPHTS